MRIVEQQRESSHFPTMEVLCQLSPQGTVRSMSVELARVTGWEEVEWLGKPIQKLLHSADVSASQEPYSQVLRGESVTCEGMRFLARDGGYVPLTVSFIPRVKQKVVEEILVLGARETLQLRRWERDHDNVVRIHQGKAAQLEKVPPVALFGLLETLLASAPVGFALFDTDLRFICLNPSFAKMTGFAPEQLIGESLLEKIPSLVAAKDTLGRVVQGETILDCELSLQGFVVAEQSTCGRFSFYPIRDAAQTTIGIAAIAQDITSQKRAIRLLHESEERLTLALESAQLGTLDLDVNTGKLIWSARTKALAGLGPTVRESYELFLGTLHPEDRERVEKAMELAKTPVSGGDYHVEYRAIGLEDRKERWLSVLGKVSFDEALSPRRFTGTVMDITERKQSEEAVRRLTEELERSNLALFEFARTASHDLKEPLRMVTQYLKILEKQYRGRLDPNADAYIHFAMDGASRMGQLIEKILEYACAGRKEQKPSFVDLGTLLAEVLHDLEVSIGETGAQVRLSPLPTIWGDKHLLAQVFQNLIANALKFRGPNAPKIYIGAERRPGEWLFSVADNGIGIPRDNFDSVFAPFRRLHSHTEYPGSGLGLSICKKNIEYHGGKLWLASKEGTGTTFFFTLPCDESRGQPKP